MSSFKELYLVILFDPSQPLSVVMNPFQGNALWETEFVSDVSLLSGMFQIRVPDALILFPTRNDLVVSAQVKFLRRELSIDRVPIVAFHTVPSANDIMQFVSTLSDKER